MEPSELKFGTIYVHSREIDYMLIETLQYFSGIPGMDIEHVPDEAVSVPTLVARRMNLGNLGHAAVVRMVLYGIDQIEYFNSDFRLRQSLKQFTDVLTDVAATDSGDRELHCDLTHESRPVSPSQRSFPKVEMTGAGVGFKLNLPNVIARQEVVHEMMESGAASWKEEEEKYCTPPVPDPLGEREENETRSLEAEKQEAFDQLKRAVLNFGIVHKKDPTELIQEFIQGKYVIGADGLSPLLVNGDLEIVLPGYDEVCVRMPALCRAIYILFLKHRHDGIVLKHFADYRSEFEEIYSMVMPGRDEHLAVTTINNLCNPMSNTLQEYISRIKRCFATVLADTKLLAHYIISGQRGATYKIQLSDDLVTLPSAITA